MLTDPEKLRRWKLEKFRESFLLLTADGQYPPDRQNRLYQATIESGLDWQVARQYVRPDAERLFQRHVQTLAAYAPSAEEMAELHRLRRRLGLDQATTARLMTPAPSPLPALPASRSAPASSRTWAAIWRILLMGVISLILWPIVHVPLALALALVGLLDNLAPVLPLISMGAAIVFTMHVRRRKINHNRQNTPQALPVPPGTAQPAISVAQLPALPLAPAPAPVQKVHAAQLQASVQHLSGAQFELWVKDRLAELGWQQLQTTGGRGDRGVDVRGIYQGKRCIVQCKHYPGRLVPPNEVRALVGTRNIQRAQRAYLITSGKFSYQCYQEVHRKPVELWDLESLAVHLNNRA